MADKIIHPARKTLVDQLDHLRGIPALILIPAVLYGASWLVGELLGLAFPFWRDPDPSMRIMSGFGFLMILGVICGSFWATKRG
jgi:hypothetical protein